MLTVALIGFGRIGKMHYQILAQLKSINVRYIVDDVTDHASLLNIRLSEGTPPPRLKRIADLHDVLTDQSIDAVIICTSSDAHVTLIEEAIKHQKAIFCEKPVSFDIKTLTRLRDHLNQANIKCQVGLNRRFDPDYLTLQHRLHSGEIGAPHIIKITNRDPRSPDPKFVKKSGGLFYDFNTHDFDMLYFLTCQSVKEAFVMGDALIDPRLKTLYDIDTAIITLKLANDALVVIDTSRETQFGYDQRIEIFGENGMLRVDNMSESTLQMVSSLGETHALPYWSFVERYKQAYRNEFLAFIDYVTIPNAQSPASIDDMMRSVRVANMVEQAFKENALVESEG